MDYRSHTHQDPIELGFLPAVLTQSKLTFLIGYADYLFPSARPVLGSRSTGDMHCLEHSESRDGGGRGHGGGGKGQTVMLQETVRALPSALRCLELPEFCL